VAVGDITATNLGVVSITGSALKTLLDAQNLPGTNGTAGSQTAEIKITYIGNGQVHVVKLSRATA
jgi:hypothetical protein